jgi:hypothetical protein
MDDAGESLELLRNDIFSNELIPVNFVKLHSETMLVLYATSETIF